MITQQIKFCSAMYCIHYTSIHNIYLLCAVCSFFVLLFIICSITYPIHNNALMLSEIIIWNIKILKTKNRIVFTYYYALRMKTRKKKIVVYTMHKRHHVFQTNTPLIFLCTRYEFLRRKKNDKYVDLMAKMKRKTKATKNGQNALRYDAFQRVFCYLHLLIPRYSLRNSNLNAI